MGTSPSLFSLAALLPLALVGCQQRQTQPTPAGSASGAENVVEAAAPAPVSVSLPLEDVLVPVELIEKTTLDGPRAELVKDKRAELLAATAKALRDVTSLLVTQRPIVVEEKSDALVVHGMPKLVHLALTAQTLVADINVLFFPLRPLLGGGPVRQFPQGNGTLSASDADGGARAALAPWIARLPERPDLRYVLRDVCSDGDHRELGIEVVRGRAPLAGAFLKRVRVAHAGADAGPDAEGLDLEVHPEASEGLFGLAKMIGRGNLHTMLVWGDRVLWWSWASVLVADQHAVFTAKTVAVHGFHSNCRSPSSDEAAERVRAAALLEDARR